MWNSLPVCRIVVQENTTTLRVSTAHLEHQLSSPLDNDLGRPDLHVHTVNLTRDDGLYVCGEVLAPWQVRPVLRVVSVDLA